MDQTQTDPSKSGTLRIDIVSDVVCPWCIVGYKQLERALSEAGTQADIHWHPYEINPHMPPDGEDLRAHMAKKYGTTPEESDKSRARLTDIGRDLGFAFNYSDDTRMYNTFQAHQLLHWAETLGRQHDLKLAMFKAFFTDRRNVSDPEVLADIAEEIGLDRSEAVAVLQEERHAKDIREEENFWLTNKIQGVPAVIFNQKHLVTGAQGTENYTSILRKLATMAD